MRKKYLLWDFDNTLAYRGGWSHTIFDLLKDYGCDNMTNPSEIRMHLKKGVPLAFTGNITC